MLKNYKFKSKIEDLDFEKISNDGIINYLKRNINKDDDLTDELKRQINENGCDFNDASPDILILEKKIKRIGRDSYTLLHRVMTSGDVQASIDLSEKLFHMELYDYMSRHSDEQRTDESLDAQQAFIPNSHNIFKNHQGKTTGGRLGGVLARSGVKMIFIFMQRMWRVGDDLDVDSCVEVMKNAVLEIREIPVAGMFNMDDENENLPFWSGVTEQTYQFLEDTVLCNAPGNENVSKSIRDAALNLMLEMGLIYGTLSLHLKHVILLIQQSTASKNYSSLSTDSKVQTNKPMLSSHILPMLRRLVLHVKKSYGSDNFYKHPQIMNNPCIRLLHCLKFELISDEESLNVDACLLNAAVVMMNCLDYLTIEQQLSYISWFKTHHTNVTESIYPGDSYQKCDDFFEPLDRKHERFSHKLHFVKVGTKGRLDCLSKRDIGDKSHEMIDVIGSKLSLELGDKYRIKKVICSGKSIYVLTECGWLYEVPISSEMTADGVIESFTLRSNAVNHFFQQEANVCEAAQPLDSSTLGKLVVCSRVVDVDTNMYSAHVMVVTANGNVFSWGHNSSGKLGHGDVKERTCPTVIQSLLKCRVVVTQVACGSEHSLILSQTGDMYACGRNHMGQLGLGDVKDRHLASRVPSVLAAQIAADGEQSMCLSSDGLVMTWGSTFDTCRRHASNWTPQIDGSVSVHRGDVDRIYINESTYVVLLRSGEVYNWLKYCLECDSADDRLPSSSVKMKLQMEHVTAVVNGDGDQFYLDTLGQIRAKKTIVCNDLQFAGFSFVKYNLMLAWTPVKAKSVLAQPFVLEVSVESLQLLQSLIESVTVHFVVTEVGNKDCSNWFQCFLRSRPSCKSELTEDRLCVLVSSLHLLSCQLRKVVDERLAVPQSLLTQLKHDIVNCCCGLVSQLHPGIKHAAHMCLISGWRVLFASQMDKLLGIYHTLHVSDACPSRYNLIVAMCLDTVHCDTFVDTLLDLSTVESPTIDCVLDTFLRFVFANIRTHLDRCLNDSKSTTKEFANDDDDSQNGLDPSEHSIMTKMIVFLKNLLKQVVGRLQQAKSVHDHGQQNMKLVLAIYGKIMAQQAIETIEHCWCLINRSTGSGRSLIEVLHRHGFSKLIANFVESIRWLLKTYLGPKSVAKPESAKTSKSSFSKPPSVNQSSLFDSLFKFSLTLREMLFLFKPLVTSLDKISGLNDAVVCMDNEDGSMPGWLCNGHSELHKLDKVMFRNKDVAGSLDHSLVIVDDRVYDLEVLSLADRRKLEDYLPDRKSSNITNALEKCFHRKEAQKLLAKCYCGEFVDDDHSPITYTDRCSKASGKLYLLERMLLGSFSDVLLFHQSCCTMMKRSIGFKQLQEFSTDKWPPVLKQICLKKRCDVSQFAAETSCIGSLSTNNFEEKERDEVEETKDENCDVIAINDGNIKVISGCVNLLAHGTAVSLIEKGGSTILLNILQWLRSDHFRDKHAANGNSVLLLDNIQDSHLDSSFVLLFIALTRHNNMCMELANHIIKRNYDQPISSELAVIIRNSINVRKEIIKRHQQNGTPYKDVCAVIVTRCKFLIDEIELLNGSKNNRKKSHCFFDIVNDISPSNRWKWLLIRSKTLQTHSTKPVDYWQLIFDVINRRRTVEKCTPNRPITASVSSFDNLPEFCGQICQFLLCKESIDLQKFRTLSLAQKMQYKCIINVLKEFKILIQFGNSLLPGAQSSLLQFLCHHVETNDDTNSVDDDTEHVFDILRVMNGASASNFISQHLKHILVQTEKSLVQCTIQILRKNLVLNDQNLETMRSLNERTSRTSLIPIGHWPTCKINMAVCHLLVQSVTWSSDVSNIILASGVLGLVQTLFRQYQETELGLVSIWYDKSDNYQLCLATSGNRCHDKKTADSLDDLGNAEIATAEQLTKGSLVLRGRDWKYGDQDGPNSVGIVKREAIDGMVRVQWLNNHKTGSYRVGKDSSYDLQLKRNKDERCDLNILALSTTSSAITPKKSRSVDQKVKDDLPDKFGQCLWSQSSIFLLHSFGQLMQAISLQEVIHSHPMESFQSSTTSLSKIFQLIWMVYKNGLLPSDPDTQSVTQLHREQMSLWCNNHFLLTLISNLHGSLPNISRWVGIFLAKTEIQVNVASNDNIVDQIVIFKIMSKLLERFPVTTTELNRLWKWLKCSVFLHCSQNAKSIFNVHSLNAEPSKIRIMELSMIFRHLIQPTSPNFEATRCFLFTKMHEYLQNEDDDPVLGLSICCVMSDVEDRIYPGTVASCSSTSEDPTESNSLGIVEKISYENDQHIFTTVAETMDYSLEKEMECHSLSSRIKIDTSSTQFPFKLFESLNAEETEIASHYFASVISKLMAPNESQLSKICHTKRLLRTIQLATIVALSEQSLNILWASIQKCDKTIFKSTLDVATRTISVRTSFPIDELQQALLQLSDNRLSTSLTDYQDSDSDESTHMDEGPEEIKTVPKGGSKKSKRNQGAKGGSRKSKSHDITKNVPINADVHSQIMEMGFTKRQIQLALRDLSLDQNPYIFLNPDLIITTILSKQIEDEYSLSADEESSIVDSSDISTTSESQSLNFTQYRPRSQMIFAASADDDEDENSDEDSVEENYTEPSCSSIADDTLETEHQDLNPVVGDSSKMFKYPTSADDLVLCVTPFDSVVIGDVGLLKEYSKLDGDSCLVYWLRLDCDIISKKSNLYVENRPYCAIKVGDNVQLTDAGIRSLAVSVATGVSVGLVRQISSSESSVQLTVDFPQCLGMTCSLDDLTIVANEKYDAQCRICLKKPLVCPIYLCIECGNMHLCSSCHGHFYKRHQHKFQTIGSSDKSTSKSPTTKAASLASSSGLHCHNLLFQTMSVSTNKTELKQCLSFTEWDLQPEPSNRFIRVMDSYDEFLVKVAGGFQIERILMLISLSDFLTLPTHAIVKCGSKSFNMHTVSNTDVNDLKRDITNQNISKYYDFGLKLMWLKIYQKPAQAKAANNVFNVSLLDKSNQYRKIFNAVKALHFHLSKVPATNQRHINPRMFSTSSLKNDTILKSMFTISDSCLGIDDMDSIMIRTLDNWRHARVKKLLFQVNFNDENDNCTRASGDFSATNNDMSNSTIGLQLKKKMKARVYLWGLNDKDQLGCEATSKVKLPILNEILSDLDVISITGGSKSLFCVTRTGKVYAAGDPSNGRLGVTTDVANITGPKHVSTLDRYFIVKVAVHSGGRHSLALTKNGEVFSWGEGDDGKLGHNSRMKIDLPRKIRFFKGKRVVDIACGSSHSAAIVYGGHLYTWGLGEYGRLGHGDTLTKLLPEIVKGLLKHKIVQVACGSRDAQSLALSSDYTVWSWGDGDFGKLGRGGSSGCLVPQKVECLNQLNVIQIECGAQSSFSLTDCGQVWTWGKGDYYRLGHGTDKHMREPTLVEDLKDVKIIRLAVGALHCLAVSDQGLIYSWGDNDHGQQGNGTVTYNMRPTIVSFLADIKVCNVACGSSHSVAWTASDPSTLLAAHYSLNTWPHIQDVPNDLADVNFSPVSFTFPLDPLGASDLLDIDENIHMKKTKVNDALELSEASAELSGSEETLAVMISQLRGTNIQVGVIQSLYNNVKILVARSLVSKFVQHYLEQSLLENTEIETGDAQTSSIEIFLLIFDYLKLYQSDTEACAQCSNIFANIDWKTSKNLRQIVLLTIIDELEKYGDGDLNRSNDIHCFCDNKDFVNLLREKRSVQFVRESSHPYGDNCSISGKLTIPGAQRLVLEFDHRCRTERNEDVLTIMDGDNNVIAKRSGQRWEDWSAKVIVNGNKLSFQFKSDGSISLWGWRFTAKALSGQQTDNRSVNSVDTKSEIKTVFSPNLRLLETLIDRIHLQTEDTSLALLLIKALSKMAFTRGDLSAEPRIAAISRISAIIGDSNLGVYSQFMKSVENFSEISSSVDGQLHSPEEYFTDTYIECDADDGDDDDDALSDPESDAKNSHSSRNVDIICGFLRCLQKIVLEQFKHEEVDVKSGKQLSYSRFMKNVLSLSCLIKMDNLPSVSSVDEWAWFRSYCVAQRTTDALVTSTSLPHKFINDFKAKSTKESSVKRPDPREPSSSWSAAAVCEYADPREFSFQHDVQLIRWLRSQPENWKKCWPTDSSSGLEVWAWGHNHRGQLGGIEGSKVKVPVLCDHISALRPRQIVGGEQSLFIVSVDGRVYASGFGNNGRLGICGCESVQTPILVSGLEEKKVVKVAVNSGGKHCLALTSTGLVYAWGEIEDYKLGLGNRRQFAEDVTTPTLVNALVKAEIVDIAAGGSHSAAISASGELYTWGKGRYGRLGHGDGDDQPLPKVVESLRGQHVLKVACGSGDAQTLCITRAVEDLDSGTVPNTSVWSWGDGDYGKLGRGGCDICKLPMKIESLEGKGVIKVDCGSQFSLALTSSGEVYTWGKGDYFRLGHGSDNHVRKPEFVQGLSKKKVMDVACGSLHCICCTEEGEVYSWGDNDEGQLGDGTTTTNSRPRIIETLTGKGINRVACGSAHTFSWTTISGGRFGEVDSDQEKLCLDTRPTCCTLLENKSAASLINRFLLLHNWTEMFCSNLHFFNLNKQSTMDYVRQILIPSSKESLFRIMIQTSMVGNKKHGPEIKVNRLHASAGTPAGVTVLSRSEWLDSEWQTSSTTMVAGRSKVQLEKTVFGQLASKLIEETDCISKNGSIYVPTSDYFLLPNRIWKVKLIGESVDDCGGGYSESMAEICDELQNGHLPLMVPSPDRDCFLFSPDTGKGKSKWFVFLGCLFGIAIRTNQPLSLQISDLIWKILSGQMLQKNDLQLLDKDLLNSLMSLKMMDEEELANLQISFSANNIEGLEVQLTPNNSSQDYTVVTTSNRDEYIESVIRFKIHEFDDVCSIVRRGMSLVIPLTVLNLFSSRELECLVCGNESIPVPFLKSITLYRGVKCDDVIITWFWEIMDEMTNEVRSLFLRFVWGRTRLPRYVSDLRGKEFVIQVLNKYSPADDYLPEAYTCFFLLKLPHYTCKAVLQEKLLYAIHFCKSIDIDDYARISLNPDSLPSQDLVPVPIRRDECRSRSSSSGSNSHPIYISSSSSSSSSSTTSSSDDGDSVESAALVPDAFDSSPSLSVDSIPHASGIFDAFPLVGSHFAIQRNNQYLMTSDNTDIYHNVFDWPRYIDNFTDGESSVDDDIM